MGKRIGTSIIGIPLYFLVALFILIIFQGGWDYIVGDRTVFRLVLLISSIIGISILLIFSFITKKTIIKILQGQLGTR